jgi:hypothetical protein
MVMSDELDRFDDALREWARHPPRTSPADAAGAVTTAIAADRRRRATRWSALAAAAALAMAASVTLLWQPAEREATVVVRDHVAPDGLAEGVVLMWLDDETPLYMTFQLPGNGAAGNGVTP